MTAVESQHRRAGCALVAVLAAVTATLALTSAPAAAENPPSSGPIIQTVAGTGTSGYGGDGGPATAADLSHPGGLASDGAGNVYLADLDNHRVRKVDASGTITTVAGNGTGGLSGDGGVATAAQLHHPYDVAVDGGGNLYIADATNHRVRKVDSLGVITTVAGTDDGYDGDGGPATAAQLSGPRSVEVDGAGNLYIADSNNHRIRRVDASGIITTFAGNGTYGPAGDGGPAITAQLYHPIGLALDAANLFIADTFNHRVRKVDPSGIITTAAGTPRVTTRIEGRDPNDIDPAIADILSRLAGAHPLFSGGGYGGDGGPATAADLNFPEGVTVDGGGTLYIADTSNQRVRKVDPSGTITTAVGSDAACGYGGDGRSPIAARLCHPTDMAVDGTGNLLVSDTGNHRVRVVGTLSLAITDAPDPVPVGGQLTYTLRAGNYSQTTASAATVTDTLPPEVTFGSAIPSQGTCTRAGTTVRCELGDIPAGVVATVAITVTAPTDLTILSNTATLAATHPDSVVADDAATEQTTVAAPTLQLAKTDAPDPAAVGQPLTYTLTATNALPTPATDVTVTDPLPSEVSFASVTPSQGSCSESGGTVTCALGTLDYAASATVSIVVTPNVGGSITNTATVRSAEFASGTSAGATTVVLDADCGRTITADTVLTEDIGPCAGTGIVVGADGITLDLGGHRVFGSPGPGNGNQAGIHVPDRTGVTVRNGTVSGFDAGIFLQGGGGAHTITALAIRDNLGPDTVQSYLGDGIYVENSPAAHIVGNTIVNNGIFDGIGLYGVRSAGATVENNLVEDSRGPSSRFASYGQGIIVNAFVDVPDRGRTVPGMRFLNNTIRRSDSAGISNFNHTEGVIAGNTVEDNGRQQVNGNGIAIQLGPGAPPGTQLLVQGNQVHGNGWDGIQVGFLATGNQILDNDAADNNVSDNGSHDLRDMNPECAGNVWAGNSWGSGGYSPECTTTGGTQAPTTTTTSTTSTTTSTTTTSTTMPPTTTSTTTTVPPPRRSVADFDGDGDTDRSVFRAGAWYAEGQPTAYFGLPGDIPVAGDYDGDGTTDRAVYRQGAWFVEGQATADLGLKGDMPVPADYDGDGTTDRAVYREGAWYIEGQAPIYHGAPGDIPVPADYDGDGDAEAGIWRPAEGGWYVVGEPTQWLGLEGDVPVPGDYDGDGSTERAVFRPSTGAWHVEGPTTQFRGLAGDLPVPGDYDADAGTERAVWRPASGAWHVEGAETAYLGVEGDTPLPLPAAVHQALF